MSGEDDSLIAAVQRGDESAAATLLHRHEGLARTVASRFGGAADPELTRNVARVAIHGAAMRYDPARTAGPHGFGTFAYIRAAGAVRRAARRERSAPTKPEAERELGAALAAAMPAHARLGLNPRGPTEAELTTAVTAAGILRSTADAILAAWAGTSTLDGRDADGAPEGPSIDDATPLWAEPELAPLDDAVADGRRRAVAAAVRALPADDRALLRERFPELGTEPRSLAEMARARGTTKQAIHGRLTRLLGRIRRDRRVRAWR